MLILVYLLSPSSHPSFSNLCAHALFRWFSLSIIADHRISFKSARHPRCPCKNFFLVILWLKAKFIFMSPFREQLSKIRYILLAGVWGAVRLNANFSNLTLVIFQRGRVAVEPAITTNCWLVKTRASTGNSLNAELCSSQGIFHLKAPKTKFDFGSVLYIWHVLCGSQFWKYDRVVVQNSLIPVLAMRPLSH